MIKKQKVPFINKLDIAMVGKCSTSGIIHFGTCRYMKNNPPWGGNRPPLSFGSHHTTLLWIIFLYQHAPKCFINCTSLLVVERHAKEKPVLVQESL